MANHRVVGGVDSANAGCKKPKASSDTVEVFCRFIVRNGVTIYPAHARYFHFFVKR